MHGAQRIGALVALCLLMVTGACSSHSNGNLVVQIPAGFGGNFLLEMGVKDAPALARQGHAYLVTVPKGGHAVTSTLLTNPQPIFQNSSGGAVWGYSQSISRTGDGIPIGGRIEFFVGTRKDYEAEENKRNHSRSGNPQEDSSRDSL
jgi:hypothetical protein